jgi:hypothetical protein
LEKRGEHSLDRSGPLLKLGMSGDVEQTEISRQQQVGVLSARVRELI